jgi:alkylation response protein AidB-like acyl-CoA dehydrogenase
VRGVVKLDFSDSDAAFRESVRAFCREHVPDGAPPRDVRSDQTAWKRALIARGWQAYRLPADAGGTNWSAAEKFIWERETSARGLPSQLPGMGVAMIGPILAGFGSPEQKAQHLPPILSDRVRWCQGYSEPGSGSDLASLRTAAVHDGPDYVVTGEKIWTSNAHEADWMFGLVRTSSEGKKQAGITFLLIDMRSPGVAVHPIVTIDGQHHLNRVTFDGVRVPEANRIGSEGQGWTVAKGLLTHERTGLAFVSLSLHLARNLRGAARELSADTPDFLRRVTDLETELRALEVTELRTLADSTNGAAPGVQSSFLKLKGTIIVQAFTEMFVEAAGPYAAPWLPEIAHAGSNLEPVGPMWAHLETIRYLNGRAASIAGGSDEVQRDIVAKHVLGL